MGKAVTCADRPSDLVHYPRQIPYNLVPGAINKSGHLARCPLDTSPRCCTVPSRNHFVMFHVASNPTSNKNIRHVIHRTHRITHFKKFYQSEQLRLWPVGTRIASNSVFCCTVYVIEFPQLVFMILCLLDFSVGFSFHVSVSYIDYRFKCVFHRIVICTISSMLVSISDFMSSLDTL